MLTIMAGLLKDVQLASVCINDDKLSEAYHDLGGGFPGYTEPQKQYRAL